MNKFNKRDKVIIVNFGTRVIKDGNVVDVQPELIGKIAEVVSTSRQQGKWVYTLAGDLPRKFPFFEEQLCPA